MEVSLIRYTVGLVMVAFGVHQIIRPHEWFHYVPNFISKLIPDSIEKHFMQSHGAINLGLGVLFISGLSIVYVSWATVAWWLSILPFAFMYEWTIGLRDLAIIAASVAVAFSVTKRYR